MNKSVIWFDLQDMQSSDIAYYVIFLHPGNTRNIIVEIMVGGCSHEVCFEDSHERATTPSRDTKLVYNLT